MSIITTGQHPKALWPGIEAWFGLKYNEHSMEVNDLFEKKSSAKAYEEIVESTSFGLAPVKPQGTGIAYATHSQGYLSRFTHVAYALGYGVTIEEQRDNLYKEVSMERSALTAFSMRQTKENVGANVYNRATNGAYTFGDGVSLGSAAHPSTGGGGAQSNILSTASVLSELALEDILIQIAGATNSQGLKISLIGESLHVPRQLFFEANRIMKSVLQNDTANNAVNVLKATNMLPGGIKQNHYFTDANNWFVRTNAPKGMICYERDALEFDKDNDFNTKNLLASAYERYSFGVGDWRSIYMSAPA